MDKAFRRWNAMIDSATSGTDDDAVQLDRLTVDLDAVPVHLREETETGRKWNDHTLVTMARAGLIELVGVPLSEQSSSDGGHPEWRRFRLIRVIREGHLDLSTFGSYFESVRDEISAWTDRRHQYLDEFLRCTKCARSRFKAASPVQVSTGS